MALVKWEVGRSVGVKILDEQHEAMLAVLNDLHTAALRGKMQRVTSEQLSKLTRWSQEHFRTEERLMESTGYPGLAEHRAKHQELTRTIGEYISRHEESDCTCYVQLLYFVRNWFRDHVKEEDQKYTPWLNAHGIH